MNKSISVATDAPNAKSLRLSMKFSVETMISMKPVAPKNLLGEYTREYRLRSSPMPVRRESPTPPTVW